MTRAANRSAPLRLRFLRLARGICCCLFALLLLSPAQAQTVVRVGVFQNQPIVFRDDQLQYQGIAIDLLRDIAGREDWQLEYVFGPWKTLLAKLDRGEIDLLTGIAYTPERARRYAFSQQTLINNWGTVYRSNRDPITSLDDLQGARVALMSASIHSRAFRHIMDEFQFEFQAVETDSYIEAMRQVELNRADVAISNRLISLLHAGEFDLIETGIIFNPVEVRFAAPQGDPMQILAVIDHYLAMQKQDPDSVYNESLKHHLRAQSAGYLPDWLPAVAAVVASLLIILASATWLARRQVERRTAELMESESRFRQLTDNIREVFWISSPDWNTVHYVSPAYESYWHQRREDLYADPRSWLDAIHPDDRDAVIADLRKKTQGDLQDPLLPEFRVVYGDDARWIQSRAYPVYDNYGRLTRICGIAEDITERKQASETIDFMAHHDPLTRLTNRFAFEQKLIKLIDATDWSQHQHALMYIDLDQFKIVNDTCGHAAGDQMLIDLTKLLIVTIGDAGVLARLGGDEFGLIVKNASLEQAQALADEILQAIQMFRFEWNKQKFSVGASIGLVMMSNSNISRDDLLSAADMACYAAKERGRNRLHIYTEDDVELMQRQGEMQWVNRIKAALEENRFVIYRQSIHPLQSDGAQHNCAEFLFRMVDESGELIMPGTFIPAAERYELMPQLDHWVVRNVIDYLQQLRTGDSQDELPDIAFINLSGQVFNDDQFADFILELLHDTQIDPQNICLEITETAAISNLDKAIKFIEQLRALGFSFALDDFGSGMSSFSYLKFLPVDFLKIDGMFIRDLSKDPMNRAIVEAITRIGHTAQLKVIAEWVEDQAALDQLVDIGIDFAQGYAIDRPTPALTGGAPSRARRH